MKNQFSGLSGKELVAAGHQFAKSLDADAPLIEIAKLFSEMASRLDCAIVRGDELQQKLDTMAAEKAAQASSLKALATLNNRLWQWTSRMSYNASYVGEPEGLVKGHIREMEKILDGAANKTPATDAYMNSVRAEGIHFAVNRMLAAWGAGFIEATPGEAADVAGAVLSALEFLPRAQLSELKRDYVDKVISEIRTGESKQ